MKEELSEQEFIDAITATQGLINKICQTYCDTKEEQKDLFQEMVIQLWKSYRSYRGEAKFSSWMYRVCLNVALQRVRKTKINKRNFDVSDNISELAEVPVEDVYEEEAKLLKNAIGKLGDIEKAIILLYLEDKDYTEIAEIIGITQNYVRVKINRIKKKLKKILHQPDAN